jgi:WD40 repeat protein
MDVSESGYMVTGHDKLLMLWQISTGEKVWEKKAESGRKAGSMDHVRVQIDCTGSIVLASSTDKTISIYEAASGNLVCKTSCGEVTTAMCLSTNLKHLISTSAEGIIYIWKLPELLSKALAKVRTEQASAKLALQNQSDAKGTTAAVDDLSEEESPPIMKSEPVKQDPKPV